MEGWLWSLRVHHVRGLVRSSRVSQQCLFLLIVALPGHACARSENTSAFACRADDVPCVVVVQNYDRRGDGLVVSASVTRYPSDPEVFEYGEKGWADSAASALAYAKANGYSYRLYTFGSCYFNTGRPASPYWCKVHALYTAQVDFPHAKWFFYVDNDIWFYHYHLRVEDIVAHAPIYPGTRKGGGPFLSPEEQSAMDLFLWQNAEFWGGWLCTSAMILPNKPSTRAILQEWWLYQPTYPTGWEAEQGAFKQMIGKRPYLQARFGVIDVNIHNQKPDDNTLMEHACAKHGKRPHPCMKRAWGNGATKPLQRESLVRQVLNLHMVNLSFPWHDRLV